MFACSEAVVAQVLDELGLQMADQLSGNNNFNNNNNNITIYKAKNVSRAESKAPAVTRWVEIALVAVG